MSTRNACFFNTAQSYVSRQNAKIINREAIKKASKDSVAKRIFNKPNMAEAATFGSIDAMAAAATDLAYQNAMVDTGVRDDVSLSQTALTAAATGILSTGVASLGGLLAREGGDIAPDLADLKTDTKGARISSVGKKMGGTVKRSSPKKEQVTAPETEEVNKPITSVIGMTSSEIFDAATREEEFLYERLITAGFNDKEARQIAARPYSRQSEKMLNSLDDDMQTYVLGDANTPGFTERELYELADIAIEADSMLLGDIDVDEVISNLASSLVRLKDPDVLRTVLQGGGNVEQQGSAIIASSAMKALRSSGISDEDIANITHRSLVKNGWDEDLAGDVVSKFMKGVEKPSTKPSVDKKPIRTGNWAEVIANGVELEDLDKEFWKAMVDDLSLTLMDQGYAWAKRDDDDLYTNWLGDIIKDADPGEYKSFIDAFTDATGNPLTNMRKLNQEEFADTFKRKLSDSASVMGAVGRSAQALGIDSMTVTPKDILTDAQGLTRPQKIVKEGKDLLADTQSNLVRLLVSNLSTTQLNILGWSSATSQEALKEAESDFYKDVFRHVQAENLAD